MDFDEFTRLRRSKKNNRLKKMNETLLSMGFEEVIEFDFDGMPKKTFMTYIERHNREYKPTRHWSYMIKEDKTGAFIARDV